MNRISPFYRLVFFILLMLSAILSETVSSILPALFFVSLVALSSGCRLKDLIQPVFKLRYFLQIALRWENREKNPVFFCSYIHFCRRYQAAREYRGVAFGDRNICGKAVIDKRLFSRAIKTRSSKMADKALLPKIDEEFDAKVADLKGILVDKLMTLTDGLVSQGVKDYLGTEIIAKGAKFVRRDLEGLDYTAVQLSKWVADEHKSDMIRDLIINFLKKYKELDAELKRKKFAITIGDELPAGIVQMAKVYVAKKRKIGVGDKMAGRHGNKGIVSRVVRQEDMPFLADGTPVDIVLNPLGVPSRMNIGQIFEAVLGRAGKQLGVKFATPIFDGATLDDLNEWTDKAGLPRYGKTHAEARSHG